MVQTYQPQSKKASPLLGIGVAVAFSAAIFLAIPLSQFLSGEASKTETPETIVYSPPPPPPPEIEEVDEPEEEIEELPEPEFEPEPPQISLNNLMMALNPGTGGGLMGDFSVADFSSSAAAISADFFDPNELDNKPRAVRQQPPEYPPSLARRNVSGKVTLQFIVDERGDVTDVEVVFASNKDFAKAAVEAAKTWKFKPGIKDGEKVRTRVQIPIPFKVTARS